MSLRHWLTLAMTPGLGPVRLRRLLEAVETVEAATQASAAQLARLDGVGGKTAADIASGLREARSQVDRELDKAAALQVRLLCLADEQYPALLKQIVDPPPVLWVWGDIQPRDLNALAIVGSRRPSSYGKEQAGRFGTLLASAGFTVVSGGAYGVDSQAHRGALRAGEGRTIAVLGCGVDVPYPPEHRELFSQVSQCGAILSEHPLGAAPRRENFPRRNRIISGMSRGVLVVEADEQSGALITAREASEQGRPVFAIPGRVDNPMSAGPHALLRSGAVLTASLEDITDNLGPLSIALDEPAEPAAAGLFDHPAPPKPAGPGPEVELAALSDADRRILEALADGQATVDGLVEATGLPASAVQAGLMLLGIRGFVRRGPAGRYERRR